VNAEQMSRRTLFSSSFRSLLSQIVEPTRRLPRSAFRVPHFAFLIVLLACAGCRNDSGRTVTVYTSQDQAFAEPIFRKFTRATGIKVQPVFDSEAVKTVGLANRLLAETNQPRCDLWWSNEELRTRQLAARGVFAESNGWAAFGFRSRRIVVNTNKMSLAEVPSSLRDLTNSRWRGKLALAYPVFGTTSAHFMALRQLWGSPEWEAWCRALAANKPFLVDGNSAVVKLVARGEAWLGLTDSDDITAAQRELQPIAAAPLTAEILLIPNSIALVRGAPRPTEAMELFRFLQTPGVANSMIGAGAIEATNVGSRPHLQPQWSAILPAMDETTERMKEIFLR
jgi:iron(III) transport system substrate-binding protein